MYTVKRNAIVPYTPVEMYALVEDVDSYREFLPWCGGSKVLERRGHLSVAQVDIDFKGLKKSFVTENSNEPGSRIEMNLREGPFRVLRGNWCFESLGDGATRVTLDLDFEFSGAMVDRLLGPVFKSISGSMVDSFVKRAEAVYGKRSLDFG
ncbi:MAG: type II toxin-antitoxin system RatA family toxin [Proteobacteria bacterium]|nr:MAG: type II toxin-antitoxin system RatA family toxin [Pseudomonadota bacterium]